MPMTHIPEIDAENQNQKTGTKLNVRRVSNRYRFFGTGFWRRFLVSVSWTIDGTVKDGVGSSCTRAVSSTPSHRPTAVHSRWTSDVIAGALPAVSSRLATRALVDQQLLIRSEAG